MKPSPEVASRRLLISRIAIVVLALVSSYYTVLDQIPIIWSPTSAHDIGLGFDPATLIVTDVEPGNAAAGIRLGDRIDLAAMPFRERAYLYDDFPLTVGQKLTMPIVHGGRVRPVTVEVVKQLYTPYDELCNWSWVILGMFYIATGVILVWNRPNVMLWLFAVFLIRTHIWTVGPFVSPAIAAVLIFGYILIWSTGIPALIIFASRFPDGRSDRFAAFWNLCAAGIFVLYAYEYSYGYIPLFTTNPIAAGPDFYNIRTALYVAIFVLLCVKLRRNYRTTHAGLKWIVAGYGLGMVVGLCGMNFFAPHPSAPVLPMFAQIAQLVLECALPASVAYSVIRHRSFGLGYLTNRTLVFAFISIGIISTFLIGLRIATNQLPSTLGIGTAMFVALLIGMVLQAQHGRVIRFVDRIFLPHRYEAGVSLARMRDTLRGTNDAKRVTGEVADTLGLASVAVFERTSDGGFVRNAASGWPSGTAWHLLPGEALTHSLDDGAAIITLPDELTDNSAFPVARARPLVALTIRRSGRVERAVFVGPYRDGARLDRDAIRSVHGIFDDALVV